MTLLKTAIVRGGVLYPGNFGQAHIDLINALGFNPKDCVRGFTADGRKFLTRRQAEAWIASNQPKVHANLDEGPVHSQTYQAAVNTLRPISELSCIVVDHGLYTYVAQHLGKFYKNVKYWNPRAEPYSLSQPHSIGQGLPGVEWIDCLWDHIDDVDFVFFPDIYAGSLQEWLRSKGYLVAGSGKCEKLELDKAFFKEELSRMGMPISTTYRAEGLDEVWEFLKDKKGGEWFIKNAEKHRGDWETVGFLNKHQLELYLNKKRQELGDRSKHIDLLIEKKIDSVCEAGADGFMLDGVMAPNACVGYEIKDEGYICCAQEGTLPDALNRVNEALAPAFQDIGGYAGPYSTEVRLTESGKGYVIDLTCRCGSPPSAVLLDIYGKGYAEAIWQLANGKMPAPTPEHKYGVEVVLTSDWHVDNEIHVGFDPAIEAHVKVKNAVRRDGEYYAIVNNNDGAFASVVAVGDSTEEAQNKCLKYLSKMDVFHMDWKENIFDDCQKVIAAGRKFGIKF